MFYSYTFLHPITVEYPIEVGEKLVEVAGCWEKVVVDGFSGYSPSIVEKHPFHFARNQVGQSMFEKCTSRSEEVMNP